MAKPDFKEILLRKGDKLALGVGGVLVAVLTLWGVVNFATADSPSSLVKQFETKASSLRTQISSPGEDAPPLPAWVTKGADKVNIRADQFALAAPPFEPVYRPDTLRSNPTVLTIDNVQFGLVRFPMVAYDIVRGPNGQTQVGVITSVAPTEKDANKLRENLNKAVQKSGATAPPPSRRGQTNQPPPGQPPAFGGGQPPGGFPGGGGQAPPSGRGGPPGAGGSSGDGGFGGFGGYAGGQRADQTVSYMSPEEAEKRGLPLAQTVYPLRAVSVTATFPIEKQLEEFKVALRARSIEEARQLSSQYGLPGPVFAGFDVDRRIRPPGGTWSDWAPYDHEGEYARNIYARKIADTPDAPYLGYFIPSPDQKMVYPLPMPADQLGQFDKITMKEIVEETKALEQLNVPEKTESDLVKKIGGKGGDGLNIFLPSNGGFQSGGPGGFGGGETDGGPGGGLGAGPGGYNPGGTPGLPGGRGGPPGGMAPPTGGRGGPPGAGGFNPGGPTLPGGGMMQNQQQNPIDKIVKHSLLRFYDTDVKPGFSYQYRIRVKMRNPNFGQPTLVSKPDDAKQEILEGSWAEIPEVFTVPPDDFLYAHDSADYVEESTKLVDEYGREPAIRKFLEADEVSTGKRAVVEMQRWMEGMRIEGSGKSEPVGTWVVAKVPVGPGEYIGKRQFLELPLWSGGLGNYVLRELGSALKIYGIRNPANQPKGWPLNLRTASVLVDFNGGKTKATINGREVADDGASQLLIVRPDGKLTVKDSGEDTLNRDRRERESVWDAWIGRVKQRRDVSAPGPGGPPGAGEGGGGFGRGGPGS